MEKRFLLFLAIAFGLMVGNALLGVWVKGPAPLADKQVEKQEDEPPLSPEPRPEVPNPPVPAVEPDSPPAPADDTKDNEPEPSPAVVEQKWLTLGSIDPASPYRMLVTLTNRGAAVERVEMSSPRYRDIDDRSGYLGHLQVVDTPGGGATVRVVGPGTPAAVIGLMPGDVIQRIGEDAVSGADSLRATLERTKPRQQITVEWIRNGERRTEAATLGRRPLELMRPERENYALRNEPLPKGFRDIPSLLATLERIGEERIASDADELPGVDLREGNWEIVESSERHVLFRLRLPEQKLEVFKRYELAEVAPNQETQEDTPAYHLDLRIEVVNRADREQKIAYRLDGPTGLPIEGWWYASKVGRSWSGVGLRDLVVWFQGRSVPEMFGPATVAGPKGIEPMLGKTLMYAGVDAQYFAAMLLPQNQNPTEAWIEQTEGVRVGPELGPQANMQLADITCRLISKVQSLGPGQALRHDYRVFAGPKRPDLLAQYYPPGEQPYNLGELVYYGWFGFVARAMLSILHFFYQIFHNYGIAIILLTVLVRGCMFPLSKKQALNMAKMQQLQPEMKRLQEKYKKDLEKRTKAQQDLFRKHNYNPMGGCLLMFLQLPVFIGLYRSLMVDVELRQAPLISDAIRWCSNLAAPDMLYDWSGFMPDFVNSGVGLFGLGPYFNILPVITVGLFLWQQKMFMPPPADEQQAVQQKVMQYMMIFFALMFFKVASGLCLYFIASSIWGIAERKLLPKTASPADGALEEASAPPPASNGSPGRNKKQARPKRR